MKKQTLSEELRRIKGMMKSINENEFEEPIAQGPSEEIKNEILAFENFILENNLHWDDGEADLTEGFIDFGSEDEKYLRFEFDVEVESWPWFEAGSNWSSNGDPGYPDEGEGLMWGFGGINIKLTSETLVDGKWQVNVIYEGPDFTNFFKRKYVGGKEVGYAVYEEFDERLNELAENR